MITELKSAPYRKRFRTWFWVSSARLHPTLDANYGNRFSVPRFGLGWGDTREDSLLKAQQDAVALWALTTQDHGALTSFDTAAIFKTQPEEMGIQSALNRILGFWYLDRLDHGLLRGFQKRTDQSGALLFTKVFLNHTAAIAAEWRKDGGVHLACAVSPNENQAHKDATRSLLIKRRRFERILSGQEQLLDRIEHQRLWLYGSRFRASSSFMGSCLLRSLRRAW